MWREKIERILKFQKERQLTENFEENLLEEIGEIRRSTLLTKEDLMGIKFEHLNNLERSAGSCSEHSSGSKAIIEVQIHDYWSK